MTRLILVLLLGVLAWKVFDHHQSRRAYAAPAPIAAPFAEALLVEPVTPVARRAPAPEAATSAYRCDGRTSCTQMRSCEEATFFLQNCPGTKMDGDGDGIPCERQHCQRPDSW
jgi:hypothetical protein